MKRLSICFLICICMCFGIEYSLRMQSLGTDFAYLIPDYETDLYLNPNLIGNKLTGMSYEPGLNNPLTFRVLTGRFGWFGQYWGNHWNYELRTGQGTPVNRTRIYAHDMWLIDLRGKLPALLASNVWNLYNDGVYNEKRQFHNENDYDTTRTLKYVLSSNCSHKLAKQWYVVSRISGGIYRRYRNYKQGPYNDEYYDQRVNLLSVRIGLFYRDEIASNRFTSFYIQVGGPASTGDIDALPYSIFSSVSDTGDTRYMFFGEAFIATAGFAKAIPLDDNSFVAIGFYDKFVLQQTEEADTDILLRAADNDFVLPVALEYNVGKASFRLGMKVLYELVKKREWDSDSTLASAYSHQFSFDYTFGCAIRPADRFVVDLYSGNILAELDKWAIYFKYVP